MILVWLGTVKFGVALVWDESKEGGTISRGISGVVEKLSVVSKAGASVWAISGGSVVVVGSVAADGSGGINVGTYYCVVGEGIEGWWKSEDEDGSVL